MQWTEANFLNFQYMVWVLSWTQGKHCTCRPSTGMRLSHWHQAWALATGGFEDYQLLCWGLSVKRCIAVTWHQTNWDSLASNVQVWTVYIAMYVQCLRRRYRTVLIFVGPRSPSLTCHTMLSSAGEHCRSESQGHKLLLLSNTWHQWWLMLSYRID